MKAYHLSPNLFSEFDLKHVAEGFSTALKGYGLYFTLDKNVVDYYRAQLEDVDVDDFQWYLYTVDIDMVDASNARIVNEWDPEGWELYRSLVEELGSEKEASKAMVEECGVNGIKYYDEEDGNSILVFNPEIVHILKTQPVDAYGKLLIENKQILQEADKTRFIAPIYDNEYIAWTARGDLAHDLGIDAARFCACFPTKESLIKFVNSGAADKLHINWQLLGQKAAEADMDSPSWKEIARLFSGYVDYTYGGGSAKSKRHSLSHLKKLLANELNFLDLGENENWIFRGVLTWQGANKCNEAEIGNQLAKWCIGYTADDSFWRSHRHEAFVVCVKKPEAADHITDEDYDNYDSSIPARKYMMEIYKNDKVQVWRPCDDPVAVIKDWNEIEDLFGVDQQLAGEWFKDVKAHTLVWWDLNKANNPSLTPNTTVRAYELFSRNCSFISSDLSELSEASGCTLLYDGSTFTGKELELYRVVMGPYRPTSEYAENCLAFHIKNLDHLEISGELITSTKYKLILENIKSVTIQDLYLANETVPEGKIGDLIASNLIPGIEIRGNVGPIEITRRAYLLGNKDLSDPLDCDMTKTVEGYRVFKVRENIPSKGCSAGISQSLGGIFRGLETIVLDFQRYDVSEIFKQKLPADDQNRIDVSKVVDVDVVNTIICRNVPIGYGVTCDSVSNIIIQHQPQR